MAKGKQTDAIFFGAHADDLELSCGGTIAKLAREGLRIGLVELTSGEMATRGTPQVRQREAKAAATLLGAAFRDQLDLGDGGLRTGRDEELQVVEVLRRWKPAVIFAPWPDDRHPDHARAGGLVTDAWFYAGLRRLKTKTAAHRPQVVIYYLQNYMVPPTFVVDVTRSWPQKMKAIAAFRSQFHDPASKEPETFISKRGFLEMIEARGRHFGALIGVAYGEAFVTKQPPKIEDIIEAYSGREI